MRIKTEIETGKMSYEFDDDYRDSYLEQHITNEGWNKIQFYIIIRTIADFIETYTEAFMNAGFPGDPIWVFEQLLIINQHMKQYGQNKNYELRQLGPPLNDFITNMKDPKWKIPSIDSLIIHSIDKPRQFIREWFSELKLPMHGDCYSETHLEQAHSIVSDLLTTAINTIKETDAYKKASGAGTLHCEVVANLIKNAEQEAKLTPPLPHTSLGAHVNFFDATTSNNSSSLQSASHSGLSVTPASPNSWTPNMFNTPPDSKFVTTPQGKEDEEVRLHLRQMIKPATTATGKK